MDTVWHRAANFSMRPSAQVRCTEVSGGGRTMGAAHGAGGHGNGMPFKPVLGLELTRDEDSDVLGCGF